MSRETDDHRNIGTADLVAANDARSEPNERGHVVEPEQHVATEQQPLEGMQPLGGMRGEPVREEPVREEPVREELAALFDPQAASDFRSRWSEVQAGFVDDPKGAVAHADQLVAQVMRSLAESFARQRSSIEAEVGQADQASTENRRVALMRYRSFFDRLLSL